MLEFFAKVNEHIEGRWGLPLAVRLAHVWKLADGKVVWFENFVDTAALLRALTRLA